MNMSMLMMLMMLMMVMMIAPPLAQPCGVEQVTRALRPGSPPTVRPRSLTSTKYHACDGLDDRGAQWLRSGPCAPPRGSRTCHACYALDDWRA
eukprot:22281-Pyramimonas_sp.AAC.1